MSVQLLPGIKFPSAIINGAVLLDLAQGGGNGANRTSGATLTQTINTHPTQSGKWRILGWSGRVRVGITMGNNPLGSDYQMWAKFGTLVAGLAIDASMPNSASAVLPSDLSTFTDIWDPNVDPGPIVGLTNLFPETDFLPIGKTYIFPSPITIPVGAQLQFALILTPSLIGMTPAVSLAGPILRAADFSLLYEQVQL